ncbi:phosphagen kinase [Desulfocicer niacini]
MIFPVFPDDTFSLASKHLNLTIFNALKNKKSRMGFSLDHALSSGIANKDSDMGIYAGDTDTYRVFAPLLLPIIQEYHNFTPGTVHQSDRTMVTLADPDPQRRYILSTRIRVARNLAGYAFPPFICRQQRKEVEQITLDALKTLPPPLSGEYIYMEESHGVCSASSGSSPPFSSDSTACEFNHGDVGPLQSGKKGIQQADLIEQTHFKNIKSASQDRRNFLFKKGDRFQEAAGINRDWPAFRGCFVSQDTRFRLWINEEDHLRVISMDNHGDMTRTFNRLVSALELLEKKLNFAWDDTLGYLASCPSNIGTAMRAGVHIRLPRLSRTPKILHAQAEKLNLQIRGTQGEKTRVEDGVFDISNEKRLGVTENDCIKTLHRGISHLIRLEETQKKQGLIT